MKFGSVCSGIEAASQAWLPLGWTCNFVSEIDPFPRAVLKHRHLTSPLHGDFTTIEDGDYAAIDVLCGGTPCQSFSVAGLRGGMADERGNLALEYLRLAQRLRPQWLVWENVPGVLSSNGGRDFGSFLGGLGLLGYGFAYRVLDAQYFGLAQRRKRVFVVGYLGDWRRAAAVLFEPESLRGHPAPRRKSGQRPAPTISSRPTGGGGLGTDFDCDGGLIANTLSAARGRACANAADLETYIPVAYGGNDTRGPIDVSTALNAHGGPMGRMDFESETFVASITGTLCNNRKAAGSATNQDASGGMLVTHSLRADGFDASEDGTGRGTPIIPIGFQNNASFSSGSGSDISPTVRAQTSGGGGMPAAVLGAAVRRLTPRECERLQGFPDDYTLIPWRSGVAPDGPRYKALGNSMAVPVMAWIGRRIACQQTEHLQGIMRLQTLEE